MKFIRFSAQQLLNSHTARLPATQALTCSRCIESHCYSRCHRATMLLSTAIPTKYASTSTTSARGYFTVRLKPLEISYSASAELLKRVRWWMLRCEANVLGNKSKKNTAAGAEILSEAEEFGDQNKKRSKNICKIPKSDNTKQTNDLCAMKTARIVVIGAGAAGIAAATRLLQSGFENVLLLEAENRYGGRVHTIPLADNVVDLGAQWCHGEKDNAIYQLVKDLDMLQPTGTAYEDYKCVRSNKEVLSEVVTNTLKSIVDNLLPTREDSLKDYEGSLGTYVTEAFWRDLEQAPELDKTVAREFFDNYKKFESSIEASDTLFEVSARGYLEYWTCEGDLLLNWKDKGYRSFLQFLMKAKTAQADDLGLLNKRIQYNARVRNIEWQRQTSAKVRIHLCNGSLIEADHVICTVSLGVLKEMHQTLFTPALPPAKCRAIDGLKLGTVDKFFLEFATAFEPCDWSGFCFLWREEDLLELRNSSYFWLESVFGFYRVSCQPRLLQGWIIGPHARHMETLPEAEVLAALLWLFKKFFTFEVPTPLRFVRTRWYTNPNFRGSYTFRTMLADELRTGSWDLATPLTDELDGRPLLLFAGEATHTHFYSTVHGAVESGWREAQRLTTYYLGHNSQL